MVTKICYKCKKELSVDLFHRNKAKPSGCADACKECKKHDNKKYQEGNKGEIKCRKHDYYLRNKEDITQKVNYYIKNNRDKHNLYRKKSGIKLKTEVFSHYCGGEVKCKHCETNELYLLTIDHVNGGGNKHRKATGMKTGYNCYCWLKRNSFPDGFQVLCWNCQFIKRLKEMSPNDPTKRQLQKSSYARSVKQQCLEQYGKICVCGEKDQDVLTLDHVNDDGAVHRRETNTRGLNFYIYLRKNKFPQEPSLQVLCLNCQYCKKESK